jgi:hypothetical protein
MAVLFSCKLSEFLFRGAAVIDAKLFMDFSFLLSARSPNQQTARATLISAPLCTARLPQASTSGGQCTLEPMLNFAYLGRILRTLLPAFTVQLFTLVEQQENHPLCC